MSRETPAARFAWWRGTTRACFLLGTALCLLARDPSSSMDALLREILTGAGLVLLGLTFVLYFRRCNRCPRCGESFSRAPAYRSSDTDGLALFMRIERCPFCSTPLAA